MLTKHGDFKVLRVFFEYPERKIHIREIARLTKLSPPGVLKIVRNLTKEGMLVLEKGKVVKNVSPSKSENFVQFKRLFNIYSLYECGLVSFLRHEYEEPEALVLFGSYAKGEDISKSDIDIAVITGKNMSLDMRKFEFTLKRKINVHEIKLMDAEKPFLNSLANGIVLYGYLKVI
ncbi:MAG TPA: nucleotidyltransferase domain-containing protein [Candidatus Nanoarchaeia archaeon]|nr:nucleotidyltransferase domain-containing protein [Candidatus Aenigmarchaeota archaeon]HLD18408.1 nucleotidyltransferase domain-containing protein [Candidatus Nanoarchaeia archaeon]